MHLGVTGTEHGWTDAQRDIFERTLTLAKHKGFTHFHHGDCIGVDKQANDVAYLMGFYIIVHPPTNNYKRAWCQGHEVRMKKDYLSRNQDIAWESQYLFVIPQESYETIRSGTWYTHRQMKHKFRKSGLIIWPNGDSLPFGKFC